MSEDDGMNPRKMRQMMKQMGIDMAELGAEEIIIRTGDDELVLSDAQATRMDAQGQGVYQVAGEPETRGLGVDGDDDESIGPAESARVADAIPADDVAIVARRAGVPGDETREALEAKDGDPTAAVARLE